MKFGRDLKNHPGFFSAKFAPLLMLVILITLTSGCAALVNSAGEPTPQTAVKISNVQATAQTVTKFQVSWSTNIPANSKVEYGTTVSYGSSTANTAPVAAHQLTVESVSPATLYHYRVRSVDAKNNEAVSTDFTYSTPDSTPPTISITSPSPATTLSGTVNVTASATDNIGVASVQFQLDGVNVGSLITAAPYTYSWDTTKSSNATHTLTAVAKDTAGNSTTSVADSVTVNNAAAGPIVSITSPASGAKVSGTVTASATATSTIGIASVQFQLDGANVGSAVTTAPYTYSWDTTKSSNAAHTLTAMAKDTAGNSTTSAGDSVTVNNAVAAPVVSITSPASGAKVSGTVTASATATSAIGISSVQFKLDGVNVGSAITTAPYNYSWDTTKSSNGAHTLTAVAKDTAGTSSTSAGDTVTVNNAVAAPVVSITSPASGAKVSGTVTASATATSTIGISSVQFKLDGVNVGSAITSAPYTYSWDTTKSSNAAHTLTAVAKDTAGTSITSAGDSVTVNNAIAPPTISITAPSNGATISGIVNVAGTAASSASISLVQLSIDGGTFANALGTTNWTFSLDTASLSNGSHTIAAQAKDSLGATTLSSPVQVTISNGTGPTVTVNWADVHQVIDGFGASSAYTGGGITNSQADLFWSTTNGIGLSLLRVQIQPNGSYPELATMQKARDRGVLIWGTPWTPPASMKTNHSTTNGGNLLVADYQAYADYLAGYISNLKNLHGVDLYAFSIQNEPNYSAPWESCIWSGTAFHDFLGHLYPAFAAKGVTAKIIMPESAQWTFSLATATLNDPATAAGVDIIAAHNYDGGGAVAYPLGASLGKHLWETEVSSFESFDPSISNGLRWAQKINDWMTIANANAWHYWWLIDGSGDNEALLGPGGVTTKRLFAMGNFSKFVRPGYYRIGTSASPASGVSISAYKDPGSGKFAIVAINHNSSAITLTFNLNGFTANSVDPWTTSATLNLAPQPTISVGGGNSFGATLPPASVTTFVGP
jgi:O-glycosyl hydrolase